MVFAGMFSALNKTKIINTVEWETIIESTNTDVLYSGWTHNNQGGQTLQQLSNNNYGTDLIIKIEFIQDTTNAIQTYYYKGIDIAFCLDIDSPSPFESDIVSHNRYCYVKRDNETSWTEIDLIGEHFDKADTFWTWTVLTQPNNSSFSWNGGKIDAVYGDGIHYGFQSDPGPPIRTPWKIRANSGWINNWSDFASPNTFTYRLSVNKHYKYTPGSVPGSDVPFS